MKRAIKINLSGNIFHIDDDAYDILKKYLDTINKHFEGKQEGREIMNDIESRIAELFQEKQGKDSEVIIHVSIVKEVIEIMGDPSEIIDSGEEEANHQQSNASGTFSNGSKRLYRDQDNSVIAGVCSGLGAYFNVDPLIFRILFIVFFFAGFSSFIVYIILWIVLPTAETAAQKLEMRGEAVNVSNIEKKVKEEYNSAKESVSKAANSEQVKKTKRAASNFFSELGKILLVFVKVILIIIGTGFVLAGVGIIIALVSGAFVGMNLVPFANFDFSLGELLSPFADPVNITMLILGLSLLFLIPVIAMIYGLVKLIFSLKTKNRGLTIGASTLWIISLLMVIGIFFIETNNYSSNAHSEYETPLLIDSDTLVVRVNNKVEDSFEDELRFQFDSRREWFFTEDADKIYGEIELDIEKVQNNKLLLEVSKRSKGKNAEEAKANASKLNYNFSLDENILVLDRYFFLDQEENWRFPEIDVLLKVPEGTYIKLERETRHILENIDNTEHISDYKMGGKTWHMTDKGLKLVK